MKPEKILIYAAAGVGVALLFSFMTKGIGGTAKSVTQGLIEGVADGVGGAISGAYTAIPEALHPESQNNIVYQGVNGLGALVSGNDKFDLGGWIYDVTH